MLVSEKELAWLWNPPPFFFLDGKQCKKIQKYFLLQLQGLSTIKILCGPLTAAWKSMVQILSFMKLKGMLVVTPL